MNLLIGGVMFAFSFGYGLVSRNLMANTLSSFYSKNKYREGQTTQIDDVKGQILKIDTTSMTLKTGETTTVFTRRTIQTKRIEIYGVKDRGRS